MRNIYLSAFLSFVGLLIFQLPIYRWLDEKIVSRRERPPLSEFGLVPIPLPLEIDDRTGNGSFCRQYCLDIVFVHGLGSNPDTTWQGMLAPTNGNASDDGADSVKSISQVDWITHLMPYDLRPKHLKSARLFYYNYDSYWFRDAIEVRLDDLAAKLLVDIYIMRQSSEKNPEKRTIFVAYSYGGLVVKQALIQARRLEKYSSVADTVAGILFLGTPHYGTDISRLGRVAASGLRILGSNPYILDGLHYGSRLLLSIHNEFMHYYGMTVSVINFYEEHKTRLLKFGFLQWDEYIVRKDSATYGAQKTVNIGLRVDHKGLNKFPARSSEYRRIMHELNRLIESDREIHLSSHLEIVPKIKVPEYVDRAALSNAIEQQLEIFNWGTSPPHCLMLHGLGGCGKTQLALSYIESHAERFSYIFWISASSMNAVVQSYRAIADEIGLKLDETDPLNPSVDSNPMLVVKSVMRWLEGLEGSQSQWLVVIDELDSLEADPSVFIPRGKQGTLLVTSRRGSKSSKILRYLPRDCQTLQVGTMEKTEAVELLLSATNHSALTVPSSIIESADQIAQLLDYHPFALGLAYASTVQIAVMEGSEYALDLYLQDFKNHRDILLSDPRSATLTGYEKTIQTTWDTSLSVIEAQNSNSTKLLSFLSYFHNENILFNFFRYASDRFNVGSGPFRSMFQELPDWIQDQLRHTKDGVWDSFAFRRTLEPLISYSMVQPVSSSVGYGVRLHGLVQWRAQQIGRKIDSLLPAVYVATAASREILVIRETPFRRHLVPHLQQLNKTTHKEADDIHLSNFFRYRGMIYDIFATIYHHEGLFEDAKHAYWEAFMVGMSANASGSDKLYAPDFLALTLNMALVHQGQGNWNASEGLLKIAATLGDIWAKDAGRNETLQILLNLGKTYRLQGRYEEAEKKLSVVKTEYEKMYGQESEHSLTILNELAGVYKEQGRWEDTERLYLDIENILSKVGRHRDSAAVMHMANKAEYLVRRGRLVQAEELATSTLVKSKELYGEEHDTTLILMGVLASIYADTNRCTKALVLQEALLSMRRNRYGLEAPQTLLTTINLGAMYGRCGRNSNASDVLNKTVHICGYSLPPDHPIAIRAKGHLVGILMKEGDWDRSAELQTQIVESSTRALGESHPETLKRMAVLGTIYSHRNQTEKAENILDKTVETGRISLGSNDRLYQALIQNYVGLNLQRNKHGSALLRLVELFIIQNREYGIAHSLTLRTILEIGMAFMEVGFLDTAEDSFRIVEDYGLEIFEEGHALPMMATEILGKLYLQRRQWQLAYWRYRYLLEVRLKLHGEEHPDTIQSMADVGWTLLKLGLLAGSAEMLENVLQVRRRLPQHRGPTTLVMLDLGLIYMNQNKTQEAEDMLMEVIYAAMVSHEGAAKAHAYSAFGYLLSMSKDKELRVDISLLKKYADGFEKEAMRSILTKGRSGK